MLLYNNQKDLSQTQGTLSLWQLQTFKATCFCLISQQHNFTNTKNIFGGNLLCCILLLMCCSISAAIKFVFTNFKDRLACNHLSLYCHPTCCDQIWILMWLCRRFNMLAYIHANFTSVCMWYIWCVFVCVFIFVYMCDLFSY